MTIHTLPGVGLEGAQGLTKSNPYCSVCHCIHFSQGVKWSFVNGWTNLGIDQIPEVINFYDFE